MECVVNLLILCGQTTVHTWLSNEMVVVTVTITTQKIKKHRKILKNQNHNLKHKIKWYSCIKWHTKTKNKHIHIKNCKKETNKMILEKHKIIE